MGTMIAPQPPPKKSSGCLKAALITAGICLAAGFFVTAIVVALVVQSVSWLQNAGEPTMATYEPLALSPGEEEDVERVMKGIGEAKDHGTLYDEYVTPAVFNGAVQKIIDEEHRKGTAKPDAPLAVRGSFVDDCMALKLTLPAKQEQAAAAPAAPAGPALPVPERKYINAQAVFDLEVVDGVVTKAHVRKLTLRGREAPLLPRLVFNVLLWYWRDTSRQQKGSLQSGLSAIKLLRREGNRLHITLDGQRMVEHEVHQGEPVKDNF